MSKFTNRGYDQCATGSQDKTFVVGKTGGGAAQAVSQTITADGSTIIYITGVLITSTAPAATVAGEVTITGLTTQDGGGTFKAQFVESAQFGGNLPINFANPVPAQDVNTNVVVNVPAIASGGTVDITVMGYRRPE